MVKVNKTVNINDGQNTDVFNNTPILNTSQYLLNIYDGTKQEIIANTITECMFYQIEREGHHNQLIHERFDNKKYNRDIEWVDGFTIN